MEAARVATYRTSTPKLHVVTPTPLDVLREEYTFSRRALTQDNPILAQEKEAYSKALERELEAAHRMFAKEESVEAMFAKLKFLTLGEEYAKLHNINVGGEQ